MQMLSIECSFILTPPPLPSGLQKRKQNTSNYLILGSQSEDPSVGLESVPLTGVHIT